MKKTLFKTAWELFRKSFGSFSECLKRAWKVIKLNAQLKAGITSFTFVKKDGSLRDANGTLNDSNFDYEYKGQSKENYSILTYFDIDKSAFRCCKIENLIF